MLRVVFLFLLVLPLGCASAPPRHYQQAAVRPPPPARPPVMTPGYFPGSPAEPVYTPSGAGLPGERVHGQMAQPAPRSKGAILPASDKPGLWAADGAPLAAQDVHLFGVTIPYPVDEQGVAATKQTEWCAKTITKAADDMAQRERLETTASGPRSCLAALAYMHCSERHLRWMTAPVKSGQQHDTVAVRQSRDALAHAQRLRDHRCRDVVLSSQQRNALAAVLSRWDIAFEGFR